MITPLASYNSKTITSPLFMSKKKYSSKLSEDISNNKNFLIPTMAIIGTLGIASAIISSKENPIKSIDKITTLKNEMNKYPKDVIYRKSILKNMNIPEVNYYKLRSIIGIEELDVIVKNLSKDKEHFFPGKKTFRVDKEPIFSRENVETAKFAANLHLHTAYSDGTFTIPELMEQAVKYANQRVEKLGKDNPFFLAITDHDTVNGCKEAINIILKNPEKYENLRLVLGVENSVRTNYPQFLNGEVESHMISYGINPFDTELCNYYETQVQKNRNNIQLVLDYANEHFFKTLKKYHIEYNLEEFDKLSPQIKHRNILANYLTKDYFQFKLIYTSMVEKNEALLEATNLKPETIDFISPQKLIGENLDYSNGQKYYEYYIDAIKKDLKSKLPEDKHREVDKYLRYIPEEIIPILNEIEYSICNKNSQLYVQKITHPTFEEAINFLKTKDGVLGIAHPSVVFPLKNLKTNAETLMFYDKLYTDFKNIGKHKAKYAEDHYATYFENQNKEFLDKLSEISSQHGLEKTGGLDTHISDIFCSK